MDPVTPPVKPLLSGYKLIVGYVVGGIVITATVIVGIVKWNSWFDKPKPETVDQSQTVPVQTNPLAQFDGSYSGTSNANSGITNASVNIVNGTISGTANYVGSAGIQVNLSVPGTVDANGNVTGTLSGTGSAEGQSVAVGGTYNGKITGSTMNVNYSGSGGGESASGTIILTKK